MIYMLFHYDYKIQTPALEPNRKLALFQAKKMLPEYVFDTSQMENNPLTFPEVQTLMDGITIGGHKISDVQQVLNIKDSWHMLLKIVAKEEFRVSKEMFHAVNNLIAREESLEWGKFRTGSVGIAGTEKYKSPAWQELDLIFDSELPVILGDFHPVEQAIRLFLWAAYNQFYWDGNKRTARLMASGILINAGYGVFNIRVKDILEFNTLMLGYYETAQADDIVKFLVEKCIRYYD
ncbi:Fic family protein [Paradesulfitobacterium ferrireducens]|uniref:Fic family protein n=1 Tax=Paradesulfitobacterium ferrireducens TaxID=2816476 RepID=UPI002E2A4585|nr:Fic family protein [Paradesulfitobacterium ferrireducens]